VLFAITDIETTGSFASANSITEIAIVLHDGKEIVREFQSLVNPGMPLPRFITQLTGITDDMLEDAPDFEEIAEEVNELLRDSVFVAHNVNFDYSFIHAELQACGFSWNPKRLCTVRLSRKAFPGFRSYGLENLCRDLGIRNEAAHRAMGDTRATVQVFERILRVLPEDELNKLIGRGSKESFLPNHLDEREYNRLPEKPGVYFLLDQQRKPIYIGKAKNLKRRVRTHFSPATESERHQQFLKEIHHIDFTLTGDELIALLLEDAEIRRHWPKHNRAQKRQPSRTGVYLYEDQRGLKRLSISKVSKTSTPLKTFTSRAAACKWLVKLADTYTLDYAIVGLPVEKNFNGLDISQHNLNLLRALEEGTDERNVILLAGGRDLTEHSFVLVREGRPEGYGFIPKETPVDRAEILEDFLQRLPLTETNASIIRSYLENPRGLKCIDY
jgi:DNA polymerase-3 subunit epsilon